MVGAIFPIAFILLLLLMFVFWMIITLSKYILTLIIYSFWKKSCHANYGGNKRIEFPQRICKIEITVPTHSEFHSDNLSTRIVAAIKKGDSVKQRDIRCGIKVVTTMYKRKFVKIIALAHNLLINAIFF